MLRIRLLSTLVLAVALGGAGATSGAALAAGPDFSLSANPSSVSVSAGISPASTQVTVTPSGGFAGTVSFQVSGVPSGTSATVMPNSSGASVVFSSSSSVPFSNSTVTITGTGGGLTHSVAIQLQVVPPVSDFAIVAEPSSVTVSAGGPMVQSTIHATTQTGFSGVPTFTASGLPTGVTASFADATPVTGGFVAALSFTAASTAPPATATITVTGLAGSVRATTTVSLTVSGPIDFALSANPIFVTVHAGNGSSSAQVTVSSTPNGSFTGTVTFQVSGVPSGTSASVVPNSSGASIVFSSSTSVPVSQSKVTITGTGGGLTRTTSLTLMVVPPSVPFAIFVNPSSVTVSAGSGNLGVIGLTGTNVIGFNGVPTFTFTGLPAGVTARAQDTTPVGQGVESALVFSAASTAAPGTTTITVTGFAGSVASLPVSIALTVTGPPAPDFFLGANTAGLTLQQGASGTVVIGVGTIGGFTGTVAFGAGALPNGVTASFSPTSSTTGSTLTLSASPTAATGSSTVTVTGTSGSLSHTVQFGLTVNPGSGGGGTGGVTPTAVVSSSGPFFNEEDLKLANTASLTSLSITIVVQRTTGLSFNGQFNTVGSSITQSSTSTASTITYQFDLAAGSTLGAGSGWTFAAQTSGSGTAHPTLGDMFTVTYTTGGTSFTQTGHF